MDNSALDLEHIDIEEVEETAPALKTPSTKAGVINAAVEMLKKAKKHEAQAMFAKMTKVDESEDDGSVAKAIAAAPKAGDKSIKAKKSDAAAKAESVEFDYSEDLDALVSDEATLSEGFRAKAEAIFEATLKSKLSAEIERMEGEYAQNLEEEVAEIQSTIVEKVDSYLNYVVEQWMEDNKLAVQTGLRTEIAETFMNKLKDVFTESYIEVPESKVDLVDELSEQVEELETALNARTEEALEQAKAIEDYTRAAIVAEAAKDLPDTQAEKLAGLVESIDFEDEETFAKKVATVKEAHFAAPAVESTIAEETDVDAEADTQEVSDTMATYLSAIRNYNK